MNRLKKNVGTFWNWIHCSNYLVKQLANFFSLLNVVHMGPSSSLGTATGWRLNGGLPFLDPYHVEKNPSPILFRFHSALPLPPPGIISSLNPLLTHCTLSWLLTIFNYTLKSWNPEEHVYVYISDTMACTRTVVHMATHAFILYKQNLTKRKVFSRRKKRSLRVASCLRKRVFGSFKNQESRIKNQESRINSVQYKTIFFTRWNNIIILSFYFC